MRVAHPRRGGLPPAATSRRASRPRPAAGGAPSEGTVLHARAAGPDRTPAAAAPPPAAPADPGPDDDLVAGAAQRERLGRGVGPVAEHRDPRTAELKRQRSSIRELFHDCFL